MKKTGPWIETVSGKKIYLNHPDMKEIRIEDIAHALSLLCRFGGNCHTFYSVAEHSARVFWRARKTISLPFTNSAMPDYLNLLMAHLLHDSSESMLVDVPRPIKQLLPEYILIEKRIQLAIFKKFKVPANLLTSIKHIDNELLATERRDLMFHHTTTWEDLPEPISNRIIPMTPEYARSTFLADFYSLQEQRAKYCYS